jgi:hypothetical protein
MIPISKSRLYGLRDYQVQSVLKCSGRGERRRHNRYNHMLTMTFFAFSKRETLSFAINLFPSYTVSSFSPPRPR